MALVNGDGRFVAGLVVGYVAGLFTPPVARVLPELVRPVARAAMKAGLLGWERGRESVALLLETLEDLVAEVKAEVEEELRRRKGEPAIAAEEAAPAIATADATPPLEPTQTEACA